MADVRKILRLGAWLVLALVLAAISYRAIRTPGDPYIYASAAINVVLLILGVVVTIHEDWARKHQGPLLWCFGLLGLAVLYVTVEQQKKSLEQMAKSAEVDQKRAVAEARLASSMDSISKSTEETARLQQLNTKLQERLLSNSTAITKLSEQNLNTMIGGDSFAYVMFSPIAATGAIPMVAHHGKYPLYDISVRVTDVALAKKIFAEGKLTVDKIRSMDVLSFNISNLPPMTAASQSTPLLFSSDGRQDFNVFFLARNGSWVQEIRMRQAQGKWSYAFRVFRTDGKKRIILHESIPEGFPRSASGTVEW